MNLFTKERKDAKDYPIATKQSVARQESIGLHTPLKNSNHI